jgi:hypothetical protein
MIAHKNKKRITATTQSVGISLSIFMTIPSKIVPQHKQKGPVLTFLINKMFSVTPQTNCT